MTGISRINAIHISKDFAHIRMHGSRRHCRSIGAAAAKGSHIAIGHQTLETGHNHDFALFQFPKHPVRFHIINRSLSISAAGYNACLGAGQEIAGTPSLLNVIAISAMDICSPVARSISISLP